MVVRRERQPPLPRDLRALPAAAAQHPQFQVRPLPRYGVRGRPLRGPVGPGEQRDDVVHLVGEVGAPRARLLQQRAVQGEER
ncbi:hypothetical protein [Streptosporangium album]|uniref:hypothetical protein n=1 Tax=Streptosporangium album TaxID=47479 RepID=UPI0031EEB99B